MRSVLRYFDLCRPVRAGTWFIVGDGLRAATRHHAMAVMSVGLLSNDFGIFWLWTTNLRDRRPLGVPCRRSASNELFQLHE
jgi:hypothetical protein